MYALLLKKQLILIFVLTLFIIAILPSGCGKKGEKDDGSGGDSVQSPYTDWPYQNYGTIKFFYPTTHPQSGSFKDFAFKMSDIIQEVSTLLDIPFPEDTMYFVFFTGYGQGRELTSHQYPYSSGDTVYFWLPSFIGPPLMEWLLPKWETRPSRHEFLRHGIITLLDYSSQNYHKTTLDMIKNDKFIPLAELAVDTNINYLEEREQSAEAASFVDFLLVAGNINIFRRLYDLDLPFEKAVDRIWHVPVDSLQAAWLKLAEVGASVDTVTNNKNE